MKSEDTPTVGVKAFANLALVKYWGKQDSLRNLPATPSIGINLQELFVETELQAADGGVGAEQAPAGEPDLTVEVNGELQPPERYASFMQSLKERSGYRGRLHARSRSSFPAGAGLASSAAGFAALATGGAELAERAGGRNLSEQERSAIARVGSGSAARAVIGGFSLFPAGAEHAEQIAAASAWPELRVVVATVTTAAKSLSSRRAMESTRESSPYYRAWLADAELLKDEALRAIEGRDLEALGEVIRASYLRMHATMLAARPPIRYWLPVSVQVLEICDELRRNGVAAYETMDAGPQVKIITTTVDKDRVKEALLRLPLATAPVVSRIADAPEIHVPGDAE